MDCAKVGALIRALRREKQLTQRQLAEHLHVSDKAVSKWERGAGCPDVSLLAELSNLFGVNMQEMLSGDLSVHESVGGNMKKAKYYYCPACANVTLCTGEASVSCCGRKLMPLTAQKAEAAQRLRVEDSDGEWYISSDHPMRKDHYISFVALATGGKIHLVKQYPQWDLQLRLPMRERGLLLWHCTRDGLFYQPI